jgi:hypothetical protein
MEKREIVSWIVPLIGHQFDLEDLPLWFAGEDIYVATRDNMFVLVIPSSIIGASYEPVRAFAEDQLELINGIGRLLNSAFRPLSLADQLFAVDSVGSVVHTVLAVNPAEIRVKASSVRALVGGILQPDPRESVASTFIRAASLSPRARDALIIVGRPTLTWSELYLLFELVQTDVGGRMFELGWISRNDANLFTRTANSYSAVHSDGRHGKDRGQPPTHPMQKGVAITLIRGLVLAWLQHIGAPDAQH